MIRERRLGRPVEEIPTSTRRESDDTDEAAEGTLVLYIRAGPDERDGALTPNTGDEQGVVDIGGFGQVAQNLFEGHDVVQQVYLHITVLLDSPEG